MICITNLKKKIIKNTIFILCLNICFYCISESAFATSTIAQSQIIVSLGDSFSSGEGIEKFYEQDLSISEKINSNSHDWLAHRSENSWPGRLRLPSVNDTMSKNRNKNWFFYASSGATTYHMMGGFDDKGKDTLKELETQSENGKTIGTQSKEYHKGMYSGTVYLPPQLDMLEKLKTEGKKIDYVTLTLGGNDAQFSDIITKAVTGINYFDKSGLANMLNASFNDYYRKDGIRDRLRKVYQEIEKKAPEAKIIVAGYPKLLDQEGKGAFFSKEEADLINNSVVKFNKEIENLVESCKASGMKICFVSVDNADDPTFNGHEAFSDNPYINGVIIGALPQDINDFKISSSYSIHPTSSGAQVYADCVQKKIDELEKDGGQSEWPTRTMSEERDIVLVLDVSGSMSGTPLEETKKAASKFVSTILNEDASIGMVTYDNSASMLSDFSVDENSLKSITNNINDGGGTNIEAGLIKAQEMLSISKAKKKIIVLMSDGEPNDGKVGDDLISYADSIKADGTYIYTLGFFQSMGSGKSSAQVLMEQIASEGCHYEVSNADDLVFFFGDIADQINGQKYIYIRIACPVDVTVEHDGEKLCSIKDDENARTSFGSLTFEESTETYEDSSDDRVKILRLKDDFNYDIQIEGNGRGSMDYTIGFMDENGEYSDLREFKNVKITKRTEIDTVAGNTSSTMLKVDSDGDGKYDLKYKAKANSVGEIVDYSYILYIALALLILISVLVIYIKIKRWKKQRIINENKKKAMKKKFCVHCGNEMSGDKAYCEKCGSKMN